MEKVYVAGFTANGREWEPCAKGQAIPDAQCMIKCKMGYLEGGNICLKRRGDVLVVKASQSFYAKTARQAKRMMQEAAADVRTEKEKEMSQIPPVAPENAQIPVFSSKAEESSDEAENGFSQPETPAQLANSVHPSHAIAYTDGSYNKVTGRYGYGVLMCIDGQKEEYWGGDADTTGGWQVNGELQAALFAIGKAIEKGCVSIEIRYDYEGVHMWADGLWRTNREYTAAYAERIGKLRRQIDVSFLHIKSHTGEDGNERADELAKKGAGIADPKETAEKKTSAKPGQIGEKVNPQCRKAMKKFFAKSKHSFKDFMGLKTYGFDYYSRLKAPELLAFAEKEGIDLSEALPDEKPRLTAIRWILRGLSVDDAVHKVKVDQEVSENAMNSRRW